MGSTVFVFGAAVLMSKVELKRSAINGIVALGALAILAGGIVGAVRTAATAGFERIITFDMGGTSTAVAQ